MNKYFKANTGTVHRVIGKSSHALPCNSRGRMPKGQLVCMTDDELTLSKRCNKCFSNFMPTMI